MILFKYFGKSYILRFDSDFYSNANYPARLFGKPRVDNLTRGNSWEAYLAAVAEDTGLFKVQPIIEKHDGRVEDQGTWMHNKLAVAFMMRCSVKYMHSACKLLINLHLVQAQATTQTWIDNHCFRLSSLFDKIALYHDWKLQY